MSGRKAWRKRAGVVGALRADCGVLRGVRPGPGNACTSAGAGSCPRIRPAARVRVRVRAGVRVRRSRPSCISDTPWPALVRDEEWDAAWRALEALPDGDQVTPPRCDTCALGWPSRGEMPPGRCRLLLGSSEGVLPAPRRRRGPPPRRGQARRWGLSKRPASGSRCACPPGPQLDAARAFEEGPRRTAGPGRGRPRHRQRARDARDEESSGARTARARHRPPGDPERADARWLAMQGPTCRRQQMRSRSSPRSIRSARSRPTN